MGASASAVISCLRAACSAIVPRHNAPLKLALYTALNTHNLTNISCLLNVSNGIANDQFNSSVEFHLRLREFLQLVKAGDRSKALEYATVHLAPAAGDHPTESVHWLCAIARETYKVIASLGGAVCLVGEVQGAMACLLYAGSIDSAPQLYQALFDDTVVWRELAAKLRAASAQAFGLSRPAPLVLALECGLSAMKTPRCCTPATQTPEMSLYQFARTVWLLSCHGGKRRQCSTGGIDSVMH
eukprot:21204-Heterococcus_DN1.PRE.6